MRNLTDQEIQTHAGLSRQILEALRNEASRKNLQKVILFGSRARGDQYGKSDIDLAVFGGDILTFRFDIEEKVPTLLSFDVVDLEGPVSTELRSEIEKDGIILYEKA